MYIDRKVVSRSSPPPDEKPPNHKSMLTSALIVLLAATAFWLVVSGDAKPEEISKAYASDVLVIVIALEVFARLFTATGALSAATLSVARATGGSPRKIVWGFGLLIFVASAMLNNLAAVYALAVVLFPTLRTLGAGRRATVITLGMALVVTNLGGAATPIGDFPAVLLMASGVVHFNAYLNHAFPLFFMTALIVIAATAHVAPRIWEASTPQARAQGVFSVEALAESQRFARVDWPRVIPLALSFLGMVVAWAALDPRIWPFHYTAIAGIIAACVAVGPARAKEALSRYNLVTTTSMAAVLALAAIATSTGWLGLLASYLETKFTDPVILLAIIMVVTLIVAAAIQAGPAAAAMLPVVSALGHGPLLAYGVWVYVAFAGAICAGSSAFLWSATSGLALSGEAAKAGRKWGIREYLFFGITAATFQFAVTMGWIAIAVFPNPQVWAPFAAATLLVGSAIGFVLARMISENSSSSVIDATRRAELTRLGLYVNIASALMTAIALLISVVTII